MAIYGTKLPYRPPEADREGPWEPDDVQRFLDRARTGDLTPFSVSPRVLIQAIDPSTGDSVLHIGAQLASLDAINRTMNSFGPGKRPFDVWSYHALTVHQNHSGDTALHVAARSGNQNVLTMLYRYITGHWSGACPEEMVMDDGPPEHDVYPDDMDETLSTHSLLALITKNNMGRDAAAEARYAGNDDLAQWLDDVVLRHDRDGTRRTEANVAKMIEYVKDEYWYELMVEEQKQEDEDDVSGLTHELSHYFSLTSMVELPIRKK